MALHHLSVLCRLGKCQKVPKLHLTDISVSRLKPQANITYWDATLPAFGIRVGMTRKTWLLMVGKKRRRKSIGHYPDLSLSKARAEAKKLLAHRVEYLHITFAEAMEQ